MDTLERQWATLGELKLVDLFPDVDDPDVKLVDIVSFWAQVWDLRNGMGEQPFRELAVWVLILLTLPLSNAAVERVFSMLVAVKTKSRNRLSLKMLESILLIRGHLQVRRLCCLLQYFT